MIPALKGEELVNGVDGGGVRRLNPELSASRKRVGRVGDTGASLRHDGGAGHFAIVDEAGQSEVAPLKGSSNHAHVASNLGGTGGVAAISLQRDPAAIGEWLEAMSGRVLVHAHGDVAPGLDQSEGAVGGIPWLPLAAGGEEAQKN
jgi:hypothetical protein